MIGFLQTGVDLRSFGNLAQGMIVAGCGVDCKNRLTFNGEPEYAKHSQFKHQGTYVFNLMNLETGEVLNSESAHNLPPWVHDPLLRALKVAEFKERQRMNKRKDKP